MVRMIYSSFCKFTVSYRYMHNYYTYDVWYYSDELHFVGVRSTHARAKILSVDTSTAEGMPGVKAIISHRDVPGSNLVGGGIKDEPVFAVDEVRRIH